MAILGCHLGVANVLLSGMENDCIDCIDCMDCMFNLRNVVELSNLLIEVTIVRMTVISDATKSEEINEKGKEATPNHCPANGYGNNQEDQSFR